MPALIVITYIFYISRSSHSADLDFFVVDAGSSPSRFSLGARAQPQPNSITLIAHAASQKKKLRLLLGSPPPCWLAGCSQADCVLRFIRAHKWREMSPAHSQVHAQMPIIGPADEAEDVIRPLSPCLRNAEFNWTKK